MTIYAEDIDAALLMIEESGAPVTIFRPTRGAYNPTTGEFATPDEEAQSSGFAVKFPLRTNEILRIQRSTAGEHLAEGTASKREISGFLIAAKGLLFPPEPGCSLVFGSDAWDVLEVEKLDPDGTPILYELSAAK